MKVSPRRRRSSRDPSAQSFHVFGREKRRDLVDVAAARLRSAEANARGLRGGRDHRVRRLDERDELRHEKLTELRGLLERE